MAIKNLNNRVTVAFGAEDSQNDIKKSKEELFEQTVAIENALLKLEKADTLLNHWLQEYGFHEKPDPSLISSARTPSNAMRKAQAQKWYWEYDYIFKFIDIVSNYVDESKNLLSQAIGVE
ncbi:hypothetical protein Psch_02904 [Pelotomaculum schinkii]|uniref:Uncharacterized protein n=1 Tax=Pelotomaculum schinkii TaxID=78350 RepID=A0A4Y7RAN3_9FIRM|nr:hypothetical protein [Pelotomaculum schinkii]TEB05862.1 hypothetical protein Psch_02904 [Pelotomaculum schinkii]